MATTTNYSWTTPDDTALVKDGAAAIRSLGTAIDSTVFTNAGNAIAKTIVDAKGDLIVATAADTVARLASSASNGDLLTVDTSTATGLKWSAPAGGGKILQVVNATTTTNTSIASTSMTDTTITASITPTLATSKILVLITCNFKTYRATSENYGGAQIMRGATAIASWSGEYFSGQQLSGVSTSGNHTTRTTTVTWLDSPATTSATTYKLQASIASTSNSGVIEFQLGSVPSSITLLEVGA
jgi:hypothetical protein